MILLECVLRQRWAMLWPLLAVFFALLACSVALSSGSETAAPGDLDLVAARVPYPGLPAPSPTPSRGGLATGKFLVASTGIKDPRFAETVILLIDYGPTGSIGLVVNRPSGVKVSSVLPEVEGVGRIEDSIYYGGPVQLDRVFLLHSSEEDRDGSRKVAKGLYISTNQNVLQRLIARGKGGAVFRVYAGYAGWATGQLEGELARSDWHVLQADATSVFSSDPSALWQELYRKVGIQWVWMLSKAPRNDVHRTFLGNHEASPVIHVLMNLAPDSDTLSPVQLVERLFCHSTGLGGWSGH